MNTYADDLAQFSEALDLQNAVMIGHSTGGGEVARYLGRHGSKRVSKAVLLGAVPPLMLQTDATPGGLPFTLFDGLREAYTKDRAQFYKDVTLPFYGFNRPGAKVSEGIRDHWWLLKHATLKVYPGFSHGMATTNADEINQDILAFIQG